ncbi:MAG: cytochrome P450 [Polyangiaceae bacterium]|nr:cytochrome P450 [Polyangiaceae bacterium]
MTQSESPTDTSSIPLVPGAVPFFGHLPQMRKRLPDWCDENHAKFGPLFRGNLGFGAVGVFVQGIESLEIIGNKDTSSIDLLERCHGTLGKNAMIVLDGPAHRKSRGAVSANFTPGGLDRAAVLKTTSAVFDEHIEAWSKLDSMDLKDLCSDAVFDAICRVIGVIPGELSQWRSRFRMLLLGSMGSPTNLPGSPGWFAVRARSWLDERLAAEIQRVRAEGDESCLLGAMAHGKDEDARAVDDAALLDNLRLLVLAGHETTASTLGWVFLHLADNPAMWERVVEEAHASLPEQLVTVSGLASYPFAEALFREAVRLYPPVTIETRTVIREVSFHGHRFAPGAVLACSIVNASLDASIHESPRAFLPDRWMGTEGRKRAPSKTEACQFGGGPHYCLGYHLAVAEGTQFIVSLARRFHAAGLHLAPAGPVPEPSYYPVITVPKSATVRIVR